MSTADWNSGSGLARLLRRKLVVERWAANPGVAKLSAPAPPTHSQPNSLLLFTTSLLRLTMDKRAFHCVIKVLAFPHPYVRLQSIKCQQQRPFVCAAPTVSSFRSQIRPRRRSNQRSLCMRVTSASSGWTSCPGQPARLDQFK